MIGFLHTGLHMTTASADVTLNVPANLGRLSPREAWEWACELFPRRNATTNIWHRLVINWQKASHVDAHGVRWLIKTADEFLADLPWCRKTVYRALKLFETMGLIRKRCAPHLYRKSAGDHVNWITLAARAIGTFCPLPLIGTKGADPYPFKENGSEENSSADAAGEADTLEKSSQEVPTPLKTLEGAEVSEMSKPKQTLQEILDNRKVIEAEKAKTKGEQPLTALELARVLQVSRKAMWPNEPPMHISRKDLALLKQFIAKGRELKFTDDQLREAVRAVALGWDNFRAQVQKRTGRKLPERPQVITFTWQFDEVVLFARENAVAETTAAPAGKSMSELFGKN